MKRLAIGLAFVLVACSSTVNAQSQPPPNLLPTIQITNHVYEVCANGQWLYILPQQAYEGGALAVGGQC